MAYKTHMYKHLILRCITNNHFLIRLKIDLQISMLDSYKYKQHQYI